MGKGYSYEVDTVDKEHWYHIIKDFADANIYQTWAYDEVRCGQTNLSHIILKKNNLVVAVAQARIVKFPFLNIGIAYVRWGPIWKSTLSKANVEVFSQAIRALRNEYACKRGLLLRIYPLLYNDCPEPFLDLMKGEGFNLLKSKQPDRTLAIDLNNSLDTLRNGLKQKWRNQLNAAERNGLEIINGHHVELFATFENIYQKMVERKNFIGAGSINVFRLIQNKLPDDFKLRVFLCLYKGEPCAGAICSSIGKTGIYLFGATNETALKNKASYLIQWKIVEFLKNQGCNYYDLHGINPENNPGTYIFKAGLCGSNGRDIRFLGYFDSWTNPVSRFFVRFGTISKDRYEKIANLFRRVRLS